MGITADGSFGSLLARPLTRWGLRGDPHLWTALQQCFNNQPMPDSIFDVAGLVERNYAYITGHELPDQPSWDAAVFVDAFAQGHGMSDGKVCPAFWRYTALPIIQDRWDAA